MTILIASLLWGNGFFVPKNYADFPRQTSKDIVRRIRLERGEKD